MREHIRIISLLLAVLLLAFVFAGCGSKHDASIKTGIIGAMNEEVHSLNHIDRSEFSGDA
ncbi:MAG: hypothetical protein J6P64_01325 [Bacteroidales bacterium]|nr:hypothetical protein [Bacteroidales bacterium]